MLRNKLRGEVRRTIQGQTVATIGAFLSYLQKYYEPPKSLYQLQREIGKIFQRDDKSALSYINRIFELGNQILDVVKSQVPNNAPLAAAETLRYENEFRNCLIRGLKPEVEQKISINRLFRETAIEAAEIERFTR